MRVTANIGMSGQNQQPAKHNAPRFNSGCRGGVMLAFAASLILSLPGLGRVSAAEDATASRSNTNTNGLSVSATTSILDKSGPNKSGPNKNGPANSALIDRNQPPANPPASAVEPASAITPLVMADLLSAHQQYAEAIRAYQKLEPKTAYLYNKIGIAYERQSRDGDAIAAFHQAIHLDRKYAPAYNNLGTVYFREGDLRGAQHMYRAAIRIDGKDASYWTNLGALYLSKKDYRDGIESYQRAYSLNSAIFDEIALNGIKQPVSTEDVIAVDLCFAEVYAQAGMKAAAIEYLRKSLHDGLRDPHRIAQDTQLASLHGMPEFEQLIQKPVTP